MPDPHTNFGYSTVATAPSPASSGLSLVVQAGDGAKFPSTGAFNATIWPVSTQPTTANAEIVRVASISTDTFTITRAQESSSARTVVVGDQIAATITAKTLTDVELDQYPNTYLTTKDELIPANSQVIFDDYLELAASFEYELASGAIAVLGETGTPVYAVGQQIGYTQITAPVNIADTTESTGSPLIQCPPFWFDGSQVLVTMFAPYVSLPTAAATNTCTITLFEGLTQLTRLTQMRAEVTTTQNQIPCIGHYFFTPTAGYHAYAICAFATSATGTPQIVAGAGGAAAWNPAYVRFTKA